MFLSPNNGLQMVRVLLIARWVFLLFIIERSENGIFLLFFLHFSARLLKNFPFSISRPTSSGRASKSSGSFSMLGGRNNSWHKTYPVSGRMAMRCMWTQRRRATAAANKCRAEWWDVKWVGAWQVALCAQLLEYRHQFCQMLFGW